MHVAPIQSLMVSQTRQLAVIKPQKIQQTSKQLTDEFVINSLKEELAATMNKSEIEKWVGNVLNICKKLKIEPKRLPINKDLPGNLTKEESHKFVNMIFQQII